MKTIYLAIILVLASCSQNKKIDKSIKSTSPEYEYETDVEIDGIMYHEKFSRWRKNWQSEQSLLVDQMSRMEVYKFNDSTIKVTMHNRDTSVFVTGIFEIEDDIIEMSGYGDNPNQEYVVYTQREGDSIVVKDNWNDKQSILKLKEMLK